ncbi:unnamed protein product, partial [Mesorhabditis spiculigera]
MLKTASSPVTTTDPAYCASSEELCFNDGIKDNCYTYRTSTTTTTTTTDRPYTQAPSRDCVRVFWPMTPASVIAEADPSTGACPQNTHYSPDVTQDPPKCTTVGEFCYSASGVGKCYPAAACAKLDAAAGLVKSTNAPDKTTDPANCTTDGEKCYDDGTGDACYAPPTTTMLTTAASSEATGSTAATGSTTASSEYTGSCVDSNTK